MVFQYGNTVNTKLTTLELKLEAYKQYCEWIAEGKSKKSWTFDHPDICLTWETMEKYIKNEPDVFDPLHMKHAYSKGYAGWEKVVAASAKGENKDANTASLQMVMRNKYGWDKEEKKSSTTETLLEKLAEKIKEEENEL